MPIDGTVSSYVAYPEQIRAWYGRRGVAAHIGMLMVTVITTGLIIWRDGASGPAGKP